jgi:endonuclease/exonuclease/phosphatase family metal-dependent hydrolase
MLKALKRLFKTIPLFVTVILSGALLLSYVSVHIAPDKVWFPVFFGLAYPYIFLANFITLIYWTFLRSRSVFIPLVVIIIGIGHVNDYFQLFSKKNYDGEGIKVLSYNVYHFSHDLNNNNREKPEIIDYIKTYKADIICLQETVLFKQGKLSPRGIRNALPGIKHYQLAHTTPHSGPLTLSRFPIIKLGEIRFENTSNMVLFSDIKLNKKDTIRVYNCHFQSYKIKPGNYSIIGSPQINSNTEQIRQAREISGKIKRAFEIRAKQARKVAEHIKESPYPVIVCGDFNDTPVSYSYKKVRGDLKDAFIESGFGIANTYVGDLPSFRIDYILHSNFLKSYNFKRDKIKLSDHYPISCLMTLK